MRVPIDKQVSPAALFDKRNRLLQPLKSPM